MKLYCLQSIFYTFIRNTSCISNVCDREESFFMQKYTLNSVMYMYEHTCSTKRELFVYFELVIPQIHFVLVNMLITLQKHFSLLHVRFPYKWWTSVWLRCHIPNKVVRYALTNSEFHNYVSNSLTIGLSTLIVYFLFHFSNRIVYFHDTCRLPKNIIDMHHFISWLKWLVL